MAKLNIPARTTTFTHEGAATVPAHGEEPLRRAPGHATSLKLDLTVLDQIQEWRDS